MIVNGVTTANRMGYDIFRNISFNKVFFQRGTFSVWFLCGIGLFFHALKVFNKEVGFLASREGIMTQNKL